MKPPFLVLRLSGTTKQMGSQHGEALREQIRALAEERIDIIVSCHPSLEVAVVERCARQVLLQTAHLLPEVFDESEATARAAGVEHWQLLVAGGFSDIIDLSLRAVGGRSLQGECTIWPERVSGVLRYLVGTWDTHASAADALVLVERLPAQGPGLVALSTVGWPMQQGVTDAGLAFTTANLVARQVYPGTSFICALPSIAQCSSVSEAAARASEIPLCSARYYALLDASGAFVALETDGRSSWSRADQIMHANHFCIVDDSEIEGRPEIVAQSKRRCGAAEVFSGRSVGGGEQILAEMGGSSAREIIQSGVGRDDRTCATFVIDPVTRSICFAPGRPSSREMWKVELGVQPQLIG
jgi:hypothetical protein